MARKDCFLCADELIAFSNNQCCKCKNYRTDEEPCQIETAAFVASIDRDSFPDEITRVCEAVKLKDGRTIQIHRHKCSQFMEEETEK